MTTDLENEVRAALATRASRVPSGSVARVRGIDYHPKGGRRAPAAAGLLAGAATAGTVAAIVVVGGAPAAYAGWSATPTAAATPSPAADASCQASLDAPGARPGSSAPDPAAWSTVLTDVRGPFTVGLFQDGDAYAACFTSSSFTVVNQVDGDPGNGGNVSGSMSVHLQQGNPGAPAGGMQGISIGGTSSGSLQSVAQDHLSTVADGPYTLVDGRAQSGITGVTLVLDNGQDVAASVADGWFIAWWPGSAAATSAELTRASGTTTEPIVSPPKSGPGECSPQPAPASGSQSGSAGGGSVCHSVGTAPATPGNTASGSTGNSGNTGNSGATGKPGDDTGTSG